jgi:hypothetical protein
MMTVTAALCNAVLKKALQLRRQAVAVNLRPDEDFETEFVAFDRPRVVRVLERIAADLDTISLVPNDPHADKASWSSSASSPRVGRAATEAEEGRRCEQRWDYRHSKKIRPCVQKTERFNAVLGSVTPKTPILAATTATLSQ